MNDMGDGPREDDSKRGVQEYQLLEEFIELTDQSAEATAAGESYRLFHDMSERYGDTTVVRVELRRCSQSLSDPKSIEKAIPSKENSVIGFIPKFGTPKVDEEFVLHYHAFNGVPNFGAMSSHGPVTEVVYGTDCVFFTTEEGIFKLDILDKGN